MQIIQDYVPVTKAKTVFLDLIRKIQDKEQGFLFIRSYVCLQMGIKSKTWLRIIRH